MRDRLLPAVLALAFSFGARAADVEWVNATVVQVDPERSRVVLDHQTIKSIDMEAMTMPFKADRRAQIERFKPGDKVRFTIADKDGHLVVQQMEPAP